MSISATAPFQRALDHTRRVLFQPFDLNKWLVMGFAAFLISPLGEAGGGPGVPGGGSGRSGSGAGGGFSPGPSEAVVQALDWIVANTFLVILSVLVSLIVLGGLWGLFVWLASRGRFIFLDDVAMDRAQIAEPWRRFRREANALLMAEITLAVIGLLVFAGSFAGALALAWNELRAGVFGSGVMSGVIVLSAATVPLGLVMGVIRWLLHDFAVPVMILRGGTPWSALGVVWRELVRRHTGAVVVYALLRILVGFGVGIVAIVIGLCTCCIAALPYVSNVVLLPCTVFFRAWSLFFLEQLGPEWRLIASSPVPPYPVHPEPWR